MLRGDFLTFVMQAAVSHWGRRVTLQGVSFSHQLLCLQSPQRPNLLKDDEAKN